MRERPFRQLLGQAVLEMMDGSEAKVRRDMGSETERQMDLFRMLHAHRQAHRDLPSVARSSGLNGRLESMWLQGIKARPFGLKLLSDKPPLEVAWLLGLYAAIRRSPAGNSPRPLRVRLNEGEAEELKTKMIDLFGRPPTIRFVDGQYDVFFGNKKLSHALHSISQGNRVVPWELLTGPEERKMFLSSFLKRRSSLSAIGGVRPILAIGKRMCETLRNDLLILFAQMGIYPAFDESRIFLQSLAELRRVLDKGLLTVEERRVRLAELIEQAPFDSLDIDVDTYYQVLTGHDPDLVSSETRRRWILDELPPKIKRIERIAEIIARSPDPDAIGFLFRGLGYRPENARRVARKKSLRKILTTIQMFKDAGVVEELWSEWLGLDHSEIKKRLGGTRNLSIFVDGKEFSLTPKARIRYLQSYGLQPSEFEDFTVCLDHIRRELSRALRDPNSKNALRSPDLVFTMSGRTILSIRLATGGTLKAV